MLSQITCNSLDCADKSRRSDHPGDVLQEMEVVSDDQSAPERERERGNFSSMEAELLYI